MSGSTSILRSLSKSWNLGAVASCAVIAVMGLGQSTIAQASTIETTLQDGLNGYSGTGDTWLNENAETGNYGMDESIATRRNGSGFHSTSLIRFDLDHIDDAIEVHSATLSLRHYNHRNNGQAQLNVHRMLRSWVEGAGGGGSSRTGSSWFHYDIGENDEHRWTDRLDGIQGARGSGDRLDTPTDSVIMTHADDMEYDWVHIDVTADVAAFLIDGVDNWGWLLEAAGFHNAQWSFRSSEYADDASLRPMLTINYTVPEPASAGLMMLGSMAALLIRRRRA